MIMALLYRTKLNLPPWLQKAPTMQFLWLSLVPLAISLSYFYRFISRFFPSDQQSDRGSLINSDSPDLWGTFRSNLYFGMRTKTPKALMTGLAWNSIDDLQGFTSKKEKVYRHCTSI